MKKAKIISLVSVALTLTLNSTAAFATTNSPSSTTSVTESNNIIEISDGNTETKKDFKNMPLSEKKAAIINKFTKKAEEAVNQGTMTKEDADKFLSDLKTAVAKWNGTGPIGIKPPACLCHHFMDELSSLNPEQKKEAVLNKFTLKINKQIADGKITQSEGEKLISELKTNISNWDGKDTRKLNIPNEIFNESENNSKDTTVPNAAP